MDTRSLGLILSSDPVTVTVFNMCFFMLLFDYRNRLDLFLVKDVKQTRRIPLRRIHLDDIPAQADAGFEGCADDAVEGVAGWFANAGAEF
jgi:hypothetical protein